jgi:hypothetical protein
MSAKRVTTTNMTFQVQPNGDVAIRRRVLRSILGAILGLLFIVLGIWIGISSLSGKGDSFYVVCGLFVFGVFLLIYSGQELRAPNILIEKSSRRVTLRSRWPFNATAQSWPLDAFAGVAYHVMSQIKTRHSTTNVYGISLVFSDGKPLPLAEIAPKQREQVVEMLTAATSLRQLEPKSK